MKGVEGRSKPHQWLDVSFNVPALFVRQGVPTGIPGDIQTGAPTPNDQPESSETIGTDPGPEDADDEEPTPELVQPRKNQA